MAISCSCNVVSCNICIADVFEMNKSNPNMKHWRTGDREHTGWFCNFPATTVLLKMCLKRVIPCKLSYSDFSVLAHLIHQTVHIGVKWTGCLLVPFITSALTNESLRGMKT